MAAKFTLAMVTMRSDLLAQNLPEYAGRMPKGWDAVVFDDEASSGKNKALIAGLAKETGRQFIHATPASFSRASSIVGKAIGQDISPLFQNLGGLRNAALFTAAALGSSLVFVDDDTAPLYDFFERYEKIFAKDFLLIAGGFEGHLNLASPTLLYELGQTLQEGEVGKAERIVRGVPTNKGSYSMNTFVAGNLGIGNGLLKQLPFCPTKFRVEDILFRMMAGERFGEKIYAPRGYSEAYQSVPMAEHTRGGGKDPILLGQLDNELKGSVAAKVMLKLGFESFEKRTALSDERLRDMLNDAVEETWKEFGMLNFQRNIRDGMKSAGPKLDALDAKTKKELEAILAVDKSAAYIPMAEMKKELDRFSFTVKAWPYVMGALEDEKMKAEVLKALG